jgi:hypothetical protein
MDYKASISPINSQIKKRMIAGNSWKKSCPVGLNNLRYIQVRHWNFQGKVGMGEIIVHKNVAQSIVKIFKALYKIQYPIRQMRLVSDFQGNDWQSIEADNTSAMNCRGTTGNSKKWSKHAYGRAIDINPIENPYISKTGRISHKASLEYRTRKHKASRGWADKAMILNHDPVKKIFKKYGWSWGGKWNTIKDYQHFYIK